MSGSQKPTGTDWFSVDKAGLASLLERNGGTARILAELVSNAWDADGTTAVTVTLEATSKRGEARLTVTDDSPDGFADLTHAFTLFARSEKIDHADKRGRFNLGEKLVLALCSTATIRSTKGGYAFTPDGRSFDANGTDKGSVFEATLRMTKEQIAEAEDRFHSLIGPENITTTFNGVPLVTRTPIATTKHRLRTEIANADGDLRGTTRIGTINLYEVHDGETPHIYEMGIPVVEWDAKWHADVQQKVPLNFERDNVTPAYLKELRVATLNATFERLDTEDANSTWVRAVVGHKDTDDRAVETVITHRFGEGAVALDVRDLQANQEAQLQGRQVVNGNSQSKEEWAAARRVGLLPPAGKVTPSNSTVRLDPDGEDITIDRDKWTVGMERVADYAQAVGKELLGHDVAVKVVRSNQSFLAAYGSRELMFNLQRLGHRWFDDPVPTAVDALLIHEFAHDTQVNHLSEAFHDACCHLGAKLRYVTTTL